MTFFEQIKISCWNKNFKILCAYDGMITASIKGFKFMFIKQISFKFSIFLKGCQIGLYLQLFIYKEAHISYQTMTFDQW